MNRFHSYTIIYIVYFIKVIDILSYQLFFHHLFVNITYLFIIFNHLTSFIYLSNIYFVVPLYVYQSKVVNYSLYSSLIHLYFIIVIIIYWYIWYHYFSLDYTYFYLIKRQRYDINVNEPLLGSCPKFLNPNLAKPHSPMTYFSIAQSFWNFE